MWQRDTSLECPDDDDGNFTIVTTTNYDIVGLQEDSRYNITVKESINNTFNHTVSVMTPEAGERANSFRTNVYIIHLIPYTYILYIYSSISSSHFRVRECISSDPFQC